MIKDLLLELIFLIDSIKIKIKDKEYKKIIDTILLIFLYIEKYSL